MSNPADWQQDTDYADIARSRVLAVLSGRTRGVIWLLDAQGTCTTMGNEHGVPLVPLIEAVEDWLDYLKQTRRDHMLQPPV